MGARTRSSASSSPVKAQPAVKSTGSLIEKPPLRLFILPKNSAKDARFVLLEHPQAESKTRFYFCPRLGLYELKCVNTPASDPRSVLFTAPEEVATNNDVKVDRDLSGPHIQETLEIDAPKSGNQVDVTNGYVNKAAEFFVATPFDMIFILIPLLTPQGSKMNASSGKTLFQPIDDLLDVHLEEDKHLRYILERGRPLLESAAATICDIVDAGNEKMFRINKDKVFKALLAKAQRAVVQGLPASLEEKFVKRALEKPVLSIKREESAVSITTDVSNPESLMDSFGTGDSQASTNVSGTSTIASEVSTAMTIIGDEDEVIPSAIINLQRLRTAWLFITSSYLAPEMAESVTSILSSKESPIDFAPLDGYLSELAGLRAEALASRSLTDFGRKRNLEDDDGNDVRAEKRRKHEEEEKRKKAGESRGVRDLKKVNVVGMKKMSDFFAKKPTAKVKS